MTEDYFDYTRKLFDPSQWNDKPEALEGLQVLDLTRVIFGPMVGKWFAIFGAKVIKVEQPEDGDDWRTGTYMGKYWKESCPYFQSLNPNKYFVAIDLKKKEGKELIKELAKQSDIVIENFRAGLIEAWGLGYSTLSKINPRIIYISCSGYGQYGPLRYFPSYDLIAQSMSGVARLTGYSEEQTFKLPDYFGDFYPAIMGVVGVLGALYHRSKTGKGQYIDMAQTEALMRTMHHWTLTSAGGDELVPTGNFDQTMAPSGIFRTIDDRFVAIAIANKDHFKALCEAMGSEELSNMQCYLETKERLIKTNADALNKIVADWVKNKTESEILDSAQQYGFSAAPVMDDWRLVSDPWRRERGSVVDFEDEMYGKGTWSGSAVALSESPGRIKHLTRPIGYHNRYILKEMLNLSEKDVQHLENKGVIGYWDNRVGKRPPSYMDMRKDSVFNYKREGKE
jgi:crotonobetainyl-CoA:carnitine CoA-transferase CaiB-like acyl-CoA transferase